MDLAQFGAAALSGTGGAPGVAAAPAVAPRAPTRSFFTSGIPMGKLSLALLTLFPPTGFTGLNHAATGMPLTAVLKAATYGAGYALTLYLNLIYPGVLSSIFSALLLAGPWFIFDALQILMDDDFDKKGFQLPLPIKEIPSGGGKGGNWLLTFPLTSLILATVPAAAGVLIAYIQAVAPGTLSPDLMKQLGVGTAATSGALLGVGLLGSFMAMRATAGVVGPDGQPAAAAAPQTGGGATNSLPPLSTFAHKLVGGARAAAAARGGTGDQEAFFFVGILGVIVLGGVALGLLKPPAAT